MSLFLRLFPAEKLPFLINISQRKSLSLLLCKILMKIQLFVTLLPKNISFYLAHKEELNFIIIWWFTKLSSLIMWFLVCGVPLLYCDFVYQWLDYHFQNGNLQNSDYSNTNNQVCEVLAHVTHTWDPGGFDTGREGGEVLIGFLGALLLTSHPHTFPHSSSFPLQFLYAEQPKLQFDETHLFDLTLASPSRLNLEGLSV